MSRVPPLPVSGRAYQTERAAKAAVVSGVTIAVLSVLVLAGTYLELRLGYRDPDAAAVWLICGAVGQIMATVCLVGAAIIRAISRFHLDWQASQSVSHPDAKVSA